MPANSVKFIYYRELNLPEFARIQPTNRARLFEFTHFLSLIQPANSIDYRELNLPEFNTTTRVNLQPNSYTATNYKFTKIRHKNPRFHTTGKLNFIAQVFDFVQIWL